MYNHSKTYPSIIYCPKTSKTKNNKNKNKNFTIFFFLSLQSSLYSTPTWSWTVLHIISFIIIIPYLSHHHMNFLLASMYNARENFRQHRPLGEKSSGHWRALWKLTLYKRQK